MTLTQDDLRSQVLRRATERERLTLATKIDFWKAEICDSDVTLGVQEHILRLQIPIENTARVQITKCLNQLCSVGFHALLGEPVLRT